MGCAVEHGDGSGTGRGVRRVRRGLGGERERKRRATGGWDIASPLARSDNHPKPLHNHPTVNNFAPPRSTNRTRSCVWSVRNTDVNTTSEQILQPNNPSGTSCHHLDGVDQSSWRGRFCSSESRKSTTVSAPRPPSPRSVPSRRACPVCLVGRRPRHPAHGGKTCQTPLSDPSQQHASHLPRLHNLHRLDRRLRTLALALADADEHAYRIPTVRRI